MYGGLEWTESKLIVQGSIETGAPITFFANGERAESYDVMAGGPWMPTYPYSSGGVTNLNLRVQNVTPTAPPVTDFVANRTSGMAPLYVGFTDTSSNNPTSWNWNFGDGTTSTLKNPAHVYTTPGVYTVNLSATNNVGTGFVSKSSFISVSATSPVADFTANSTQGMPPLTVGFTDTSSNTPTSWSWNFGDGNTSVEKNPVHTYTAEGVYTVTLSVTSTGGSDTEIKENYIHVNPLVGGDRGYFLVHSNVNGANVFFNNDLKGSTVNGTLTVPVYLTATHYTNYTVTKTGYSTVAANLPGYPAKDQTVDIYANLVAIPAGDVYTITTSTNSGGFITPGGIVTVNSGESKLFNITPYANYQLVQCPCR